MGEVLGVAEVKHLRFSVDGKPVVVVHFVLRRAVSPSEARELANHVRRYIAENVKPMPNELVVLSGRGPIWLYALTLHVLHGTTRYLGVYDPRIGIVVVASHGWEEAWREGELVPLDKIPDNVRIELA